MKTILSLAAFCCLLAPAIAQTASFASYGAACPSTTRPLAVTGTPKLGSSFKVSGMLSPNLCTRALCSNCATFCNRCSDGSILALGLKRINVPFQPAGCRLLTDASVGLIPWTSAVGGVLTFNVPNNVALLGQKFTMQRADLTYRGTNFGCNPQVMATGFKGLSNGVEGTIGR